MNAADLPPRAYLTDFLLEQIASQPLDRQLLLYRSLAFETTDKRLAGECRAQATEIEKIISSQRQMLLSFRARET